LLRVFSIFLIAFSLCSLALAQPAAVPLVLDSDNGLSLPRNFRTVDGDWQHESIQPPSRQGLATLRASGSAQFSERELAAIITQLGPRFTIVDLREESHGFLNGDAVSWYGEKNWANKGKTQAQVLADEGARVLALASASGVEVGKPAKHGKETAERLTIVTAAETEKQLVRRLGLGYYRITATDHIRPQDAAIERFVDLAKSLPEGTWLHFHCRAGHGRTTTFLLLYDILRNGKQVPLAELSERQYLLGGLDLLNAAPAEDGWKRDAYLERARVIELFYEYVTTSADDLPVKWSDWVASRKLH
jgi:hypothetical protein